MRSLLKASRTPLKDRSAWVVVALYLIIPSLWFLVAASVISNGLPRGFINVECLTIGVAALFLSRRVVFVLLVAEMLADFAFSTCSTYRFTIGELTSSLRFIGMMPASRIATGLLALIFGIAICALLALVVPKPSQRKLTAAILIVLGMAAGILDAIDGQDFLLRRDATLSSYRVVRSPLLVLATWKIDALRNGRKKRNTASEKIVGASATILALVDDNKRFDERPNVVLIVVESWGLFNDRALAEELVAPYEDRSATANYIVTTGVVPFGGLTVPGEGRELCQSSIGMGLIDATAEQLKSCLPTLLRDRGYETIALHGYMGRMFSRRDWYPKIGFERTFFQSELGRYDLPSCKGAFPGICDSSVAQFIGATVLPADDNKPKFVYWVTLNSHLPVPVHPDLPDDEVCTGKLVLAQSAALCSWFRLEQRVHQSIAELAESRPIRPTVFVIVGDHAPPFASSNLQRQFSNRVVPYVMLVPRHRGLK